MNETKGTKVLLSDPVSAIPKLALPFAIAILVQNLNGVTDTLWASWLGSDAVGGLSFSYPIYAMIVGIGNGLAIGVAAAEARAVGVGDRESASRYAGQSFTISLVVSIALALPLVIFAVPLMQAIGSGDVTDEAVDYGLPIFAFGFFLIASAVMSGILRGEGAARASMYIQVAGAGVNLVLDPVLMYGLDMGVAGAGWATVISGIVSLMLGLCMYLRKNHMYVVLRLRDMFPSYKLSKEILTVGAPEAAEYAAMAIFNIPMNAIVMWVGGSGAVGIYTSAWRIAYMGIIPGQALAGSIVSVCSTEFSRKRGDLFQRAYTFGTRYALKCSVLMSVVTIVLAYPLATVFTLADDLQGLRNEMTILIILLAIMIPAMSEVYVGSAYLQSLEHSEIGFYSSFSRNVILVIGHLAVALVFGTTMSIWVICSMLEILGGFMMWLPARRYVKRFVRENPYPCKGASAS